jgi:LysM repeat protein
LPAAAQAPNAKAEMAAEQKAPLKTAKKTERSPLVLAENAPGSYTVVKGDTLWGISGKFLKEPWRWPEIWNMNKDQIKNPHLIYPGDTIKLSFDANGNPSLSLESGTGNTVKLSPQVRVERLSTSIPSISARTIGPFLTIPLVAEEEGLGSAPRIIATEEKRVVIGAGNSVYVVGMPENPQKSWHVYRPGSELVDPETKEVLGYQSIYLGTGSVKQPGEVTILEIKKSAQEINRGDFLTPAVESALPSYSPRAPEKTVKGSVIAIPSGVAETGQYSIVVLNRGRRDGLEVGHVLATLQKGEWVKTDTSNTSGRGSLNWKGLIDAAKGGNEKAIPSEVRLPDEKNGTLFVFRVFEKVSYALIMQSARPVSVNDIVVNP